MEGSNIGISVRPYVMADRNTYRSFIDQVHNAPLGDELFESFERTFQQCTVFQRLMLESDSQVLGVLEYYHMPWQTSADTVQARLIVDKGHRRKGYGSFLYQKLLDELTSMPQFTTIRIVVRDSDNDSYNWVQRRGFEMFEHQFESSLDLTGWTQERLDADLRRANELGITFARLADYTVDEAMTRKIYDFMIPLFVDTPDSSGSSQAMPFSVFEMYARTFNPNLICFALRNGEWAGITTLTEENGQLYTVFTGISRVHRGHKLSYFLKLYAIQIAKSLRYARMRTNNQSNNAPMLAVNQKLGYVSEPGNYRLSKNI